MYKRAETGPGQNISSITFTGHFSFLFTTNIVFVREFVLRAVALWQKTAELTCLFTLLGQANNLSSTEWKKTFNTGCLSRVKVLLFPASVIGCLCALLLVLSELMYLIIFRLKKSVHIFVELVMHDIGFFLAKADKLSVNTQVTGL